jgi:hypothetical protein
VHTALAFKNPDENQSFRGHQGFLTGHLRLVGWSVLSAAGLFQAVTGRHAMQDDGVNYLDTGDAFLRGDWKIALNGIWSPLYPLLQSAALHLLRPSAYSQFTVVHAVNFLIYIFALAGFDFLLRACAGNQYPRLERGRRVPVPGLVVLVVGYSVFFWSSLGSISLQLVSPDLLMAGFLYFAAGLLLRIREHPSSFSGFAHLGAVLGVGYLAKAPVFPLAFMFFACAAILVSDFRKAAPRVLLSVVVFLAISGPWFAALSAARGRLTVGESARFNYLIHVNGISSEWFFQDLGSAGGHFIHPVRKVFDAPPVYAFPREITCASAISCDPSYWTDGAVPRFSVRKQLSNIHRWFRFYLDYVYSSQSALVVGLVALCLLAPRSQMLRQFQSQWPVWLLGVIGLAMYSLVHVEVRYVAVFFTLLWAGLFAGLEIPATIEARRAASLLAWTVAVLMVAPTLTTLAGQITKRQPHLQWQVAQELRKLGVRPGDRVGRLPSHYGLAWGRLLGVTEVGRIPAENAADFWCAPPQKQAEALTALREYNVRVFVAEQPPTNGACGPGPEWHSAGDGNYYAFFLQPGSAHP